MPHRVDEPIALPADELRGVRPPTDRLNMEAVRERAEKSLFGSAAPAKLGRYVLLGSSADGGMGIVYAAYDPDLHRKVALKVLHPRRQSDERAHERLIAEARALAKLDHPNVVKVHDVITQGDQVVIVMEWVEGNTLVAWERERPRSWRDIVAVYSQAGHGLAAAHGVEVVHRDFKPSNAIVGDDGRVRVLDFGLARPATPDDGPLPDASEEAALSLGSPRDDGSMTSLTATGDIVGTLAYASPEQLAGKPVTPASDQFSFGVSLHRALEGVPPFVGKDAEGLARSIRSGRIALASDTRTPPKWLRSIVSRTLAEPPAARFPSMSALLAELARPRGWRRWRTPVVMSGCVLVALLAGRIWPGGDPLARCNAGAAEAAAVWNVVERVRVDAALGAVTAPGAREIRAHVLGGVDDYRDRWLGLDRDACVAHKNGNPSDALFDRQMLCMQKRLGDLRATVAVLERLDAASAGNAVDVVARMPRVADCADMESLQAETAPPGKTQRSAVDAVRSRISQAMALDRVGHSVEALGTANTALEEAERTAYPPVVADAALTQGRILMERQEFGPAIESLGRARTVALEQRQFSVAVEAAARKLYVQGTVNADIDAVKRDADVFIPLSKNLPGDHFARPLLLNNVGTLYMAAGNRAEATRYFQDAHAALAGVAAPDLELAVIDGNLAMVTRDATAREALAAGVCERLGSELGESHLRTLEAKQSYARYVRDPSSAFALISRVCDDYGMFHPEILEPRVFCESYRAFLASELGDHVEELRLYDHIVSIAAGAVSKDVAARAVLAAGYARLLRGDGRGAIAELSKVANTDARSTHWWERVRAAHAELGIGLAERALGHDGDAAGHLERALAIYNDVITLNEEAEAGQRRALAQRTLAELRRDRATSGELRQPSR